MDHEGGPWNIAFVSSSSSFPLFDLVPGRFRAWSVKIPVILNPIRYTLTSFGFAFSHLGYIL